MDMTEHDRSVSDDAPMDYGGKRRRAVATLGVDMGSTSLSAVPPSPPPHLSHTSHIQGSKQYDRGSPRRHHYPQRTLNGLVHRHTSPPRRPRGHAPYSNPYTSERDERDIRSLDSPSKSSGYSSESDAEVRTGLRRQGQGGQHDYQLFNSNSKAGFGFSAATWSSGKARRGVHDERDGDSENDIDRPRTHRHERHDYQPRRRGHVHPAGNKYPPQPSTFTRRRSRSRSTSNVYTYPHPHSRQPMNYTNPARTGHQNYRPPARVSPPPNHADPYPDPDPMRSVSPEPLHDQYREYVESRHHGRWQWTREEMNRESWADMDSDRELRWHRERERPHPGKFVTRSVQTSPVRIEPIPTTGMKSYVRVVTPSGVRNPSPGGRVKYDEDEERARQGEGEDQEAYQREEARQREREHKREREKARYDYSSEIPPPPPSLLAPLILRSPPPPSVGRGSRKPNAEFSTHAYVNVGKNPYPPSNPLVSSITNPQPQRIPPPPMGDTSSPPRMLLPGPSRKRARPNEEDFEDDIGSDGVDEDSSDEYRPPHPSVSAPISMRGRGRKRMGAKPVRKSTAGPSTVMGTGKFVLPGASAKDNKYSATSTSRTNTTTTFHISTPATLTASTSSLPASSMNIPSERLLIPSIKRSGKTRYQCLHCPEDFSRRNDAWRHMSIKHNEHGDRREFVCLCGRVLSRADALRRHMRSCREGRVVGTGRGSGKVVGGAGLGWINSGPMADVGTNVKEGEDGNGDGDEEGDDDISMEEED